MHCRVHSHLSSLKHPSRVGTFLAKFLYIDVSGLFLLPSNEQVLPVENSILTEAEGISSLFPSGNYQVWPQSIESINPIYLAEMETLRNQERVVLPTQCPWGSFEKGKGKTNKNKRKPKTNKHTTPKTTPSSARLPSRNSTERVTSLKYALCGQPFTLSPNATNI